jgi:hypothetical protein
VLTKKVINGQRLVTDARRDKIIFPFSIDYERSLNDLFLTLSFFPFYVNEGSPREVSSSVGSSREKLGLEK